MMKALKWNSKFKSLFKQLVYGLNKALVKISTQYRPKNYITEARVNRTYLETTNTIIFSGEELDSLKPIFLAAKINEAHIRRVLV